MKIKMQHALALVLALSTAYVTGSTVAGCAAVAAVLPDILAVLAAASQVIETIQTFMNNYFLTHPDAVAQTKVNDAIQKCQVTLNEAIQISRGTKDLSDQKIDDAFNDFKIAYQQLLQLVSVYGVRPQQGNRITAGPGQLTVPDADTLTSHARAGAR